MPRKARTTTAGTLYHIYHRTSEQLQVFEDATDCWKFVDLIGAATLRVPIELISACVMPNHFHFILRPTRAEDLGRWMQWLLTTHVRRWHAQQRTNGQVWQGRFKACAIAEDQSLLQMMRYVEGNALRSRLVDRAEHWPWSSLNWRQQTPVPVALTDSPIALPANWLELVNEPQTAAELAAIRESVIRQKPYGMVDSTVAYPPPAEFSSSSEVLAAASKS